MAKEHPIKKVLGLLAKMEAEIKDEMAADALTSKKLQCWATTNINEKTEAIANAENSIAETSALIEKLTGTTEQLKVTVAKLDKDLAEDEKDLKKLEDDREKEGAAFRKYETETTQSVQQLSGAIQVLKKHQDKKSLVQLRKALSQVSLSFPNLSSLEESRSAVALLEGGYAPHAAASGEIFGVLSQMLEQMNSDLASRQKEEADAVSTFNRMRKAKKDEINDTRASLRKKKDELASKLEDLSRAKKSVKQTTDQLAVDRKFLADVQAKSAADKEELAARVAAQTEELTAIAETVGILTSEESREHFEKTKPTFFIQENSSKNQLTTAMRTRLVAALRKSNAPELSLLAAQAQLAAFDEVKKMISDLINDLKAKKQAEVEKRDYCIKEFDTNAKETDETTNLIEDLTATTESLETKSKALADAIIKTQENTKKLQLSIATATTLRVDQSVEYQQMYQDFLTTKDILNKAIARMQQFYKGKSFLEQAQEPAPVGLKKGGYKKKNGGGVIGMIRMIIEDSKKAALEGQSDEKANQAAYEEAMADGRTESATLKATLTSQKDEKASTEEDLATAKADTKSALQKLEDLQGANKALHGECDFLVNNFDNRQAAFSQEAEALQQAIEILSGAQ